MPSARHSQTHLEKTGRPLRFCGPQRLIFRQLDPVALLDHPLGLTGELLAVDPVLGIARPARAGRPAPRPRSQRPLPELSMRNLARACTESHRRGIANAEGSWPYLGNPPSAPKSRPPVGSTVVATESVHYRTCPFCEATCGLEVTMRGDEVVVGSRRRGRRLQPRLPVPEVAGAETAPRRSRPAHHPARAPRRRAASRRAGRRRSPPSTRAFRGCSPRAGATPSPSTSATRPPTASGRWSTAPPS